MLRQRLDGIRATASVEVGRLRFAGNSRGAISATRTLSSRRPSDRCGRGCSLRQAAFGLRDDLAQTMHRVGTDVFLVIHFDEFAVFGFVGTPSHFKRCATVANDEGGLKNDIASGKGHLVVDTVNQHPQGLICHVRDRMLRSGQTGPDPGDAGNGIG